MPFVGLDVSLSRLVVICLLIVLAVTRSRIRGSLAAGSGKAPDGPSWLAEPIDLLRPPPVWLKHEATHREDGAIPWGRIAGALPHTVKTKVRTRPSLRHAFKARSSRGGLQRYRPHRACGLPRRLSIRSHGGAITDGVSSFLVIYSGIARRYGARFCGPRLFYLVQIREDGGFQLHELLSLFEVVKTLLALFESSAALAVSRRQAIALGSWSGD